MIWPLLISLSGIFFGLLLGKLSPEELNPGRRYLYFFLTAIFFISIITGTYILFSEFGLKYSLIFAVVSLSAFSFSLVKKEVIYSLIFYPLLIFVYLFLAVENHQLVISSLIFIFGLPMGSLLMLEFFPSQKMEFVKNTKDKK